jgi:hypothetical protein
VTVPFVYGGERELLVYPPPRRPADAKSFRPKRILYDTTRSQFDNAFIDFVADLSGAEDRQTVDVTLDESNLRQLAAIDRGEGFRAAMRARANTLRTRAREFQLGAVPTSAGRDPGPLETRPASRPDPSLEAIPEP